MSAAVLWLSCLDCACFCFSCGMRCIASKLKDFLRLSIWLVWSVYTTHYCTFAQRLLTSSSIQTRRWRKTRSIAIFFHPCAPFASVLVLGLKSVNIYLTGRERCPVCSVVHHVCETKSVYHHLVQKFWSKTHLFQTTLSYSSPSQAAYAFED